jgi:hypothetical protein
VCWWETPRKSLDGLALPDDGVALKPNQQNGSIADVSEARDQMVAHQIVERGVPLQGRRACESTKCFMPIY